MKIRYWGTRGSIPAPGQSTLQYGGNTSCVEVRLSDDTLIILDAGSGIRPLGQLLGTCKAVLLLTHYHWDHIQGMPFFTPAYSPHSSISVYGPEYNGEGPDELLTGQMLSPYFPAPASQWQGITGFEIIRAGTEMRIGRARVKIARMCHPGLTFGFRIEENQSSLCYLSDNELDAAEPEHLQALTEFVAGTDLLIHDCQYNETEYKVRQRWGHSTPRQATTLAARAAVRELAIFHHDPSHTDEEVEALAEEARVLTNGVQVSIAREGEERVIRHQRSAVPS